MHNLTSDYEEEVVGFLLRNPIFMKMYRHRVSPVTFQNPILSTLFELALKIYDRFEETPNTAQLKQMYFMWEMENPYAKHLSQQTNDTIDRLLESREEGEDRITEEVLSSILSKIEFRNLIMEMPDLVNTDDGLATLKKKIESIEGKQLSESMGSMFFSDTQGIYDHYKETTEGRKVPLMIPPLDEVMRGGMFPGDLGVIIGATGVGKSFLLVSIAANMIRKGLSVVYYSVEMGEIWIAERFLCNLANRDYSSLGDFKSGVLPLIQQYRELKETLLIKYFPSGTLLSQIEGHFHQVIHNNAIKKPDIVMLDYMDEVGCSQRYKDKRFEYDDIAKGLVRMGARQAIPILTATQGNRDSIEKEHVKLKNVSEALLKVTPAHYVYTVSQTEDEYTSQPPRFRISMEKNRKGKKYISVPMILDYPTYSMRLDIERMGDMSAGMTDEPPIKNVFVPDLVKKAERVNR